MTPTAAELARLFDLLVAHFRYVVVDCSGRVDQTARLLCDHSNAILLVAQADVVSLWSASRIRAYLEEGATRDRVRIVLNRYKKIPGFTDEDVEKATSCKLLWKIPNNYQSIAPAIDKGVPVALHETPTLAAPSARWRQLWRRRPPPPRVRWSCLTGMRRPIPRKPPAGY